MTRDDGGGFVQTRAWMDRPIPLYRGVRPFASRAGIAQVGRAHPLGPWLNPSVLPSNQDLSCDPRPFPEVIQVGTQALPLQMKRHPRARRYVLRLRPDGTACVTIPRGGTALEARRFVERNRDWLQRQWQRLRERPVQRLEWQIGSEILFRGTGARIERTEAGFVRLADQLVPVPEWPSDMRALVERHLRRLAERELPQRVEELAAQHAFAVRRVTVRNQKTRWGSCSRRGTISLNWRLIQTPASVRDYIILHELAHLRHLNHLRLFWLEVQRLCPDYRLAEHWLKRNREALGSWSVLSP